MAVLAEMALPIVKPTLGENWQIMSLGYMAHELLIYSRETKLLSLLVAEWRCK